MVSFICDNPQLSVESLSTWATFIRETCSKRSSTSFRLECDRVLSSSAQSLQKQSPLHNTADSDSGARSAARSVASPTSSSFNLSQECCPQSQFSNQKLQLPASGIVMKPSKRSRLIDSLDTFEATVKAAKLLTRSRFCKPNLAQVHGLPAEGIELEDDLFSDADYNSQSSHETIFQENCCCC